MILVPPGSKDQGLKTQVKIIKIIIIMNPCNTICTQPSSLSQQTLPLISKQEQLTSNHKQHCRSQTQQLK